MATEYSRRLRVRAPLCPPISAGMGPAAKKREVTRMIRYYRNGVLVGIDDRRAKHEKAVAEAAMHEANPDCTRRRCVLAWHGQPCVAVRRERRRRKTGAFSLATSVRTARSFGQRSGFIRTPWPMSVSEVSAPLANENVSSPSSGRSPSSRLSASRSSLASTAGSSSFISLGV